ncbi:MAG: hypothetical protein A2136_00330 [Chloroflexi bacterium RBG_16_54_11]|nr:MAG: hypothetical protein A2136_00330 [Chloroflexi bacterium RBG_16_54_11]
MKASSTELGVTRKSSLEITSPSREGIQAGSHPTARVRQDTVQPPVAPTVSRRADQPTEEVSLTQQNALNIDWLTWGLVFLTVLSVGGLIPLWVWIYLLYNPPGR